MSTALELRLRVFLLTLEPALALARALSLSLEDVEDAVRVAYVQLYRERGLSLEQIARRIDASRRTVATLSSRGTEARAPFQASRRIGLRRELLRLVSREPGVESEHAREALRAERELFQQELAVLREEGALEESQGQLYLTRAWTSFEDGSEAARLDSLRHFLRAVTETVRARFLAPAPEEEAFARVLTFSASKEDLGALRQQLYDLLCSSAAAIDERAASLPEAAEAMVAFCVARVRR